jgi:hypothetical protein
MGSRYEDTSLDPRVELFESPGAVAWIGAIRLLLRGEVAE